MLDRRTQILLTYLAIACYVLGVLLPFVRIQPGAALPPAPGFVVWLLSDDAEAMQTVLSGIATLWSTDPWLAAIVFAFSVAFPVTKLALLLLLSQSRWRASAQVLKVLKVLGPWSMMDVFVVSFFIAWLKGIPGGTVITIGSGCFFFAASVVFSMIASWLMFRDSSSSPHPVPPVSDAVFPDSTGTGMWSAEASESRVHPAG